MKVTEMIGKKFERLEVLEIVGRDKSGRARIRCRCECGIEKEFDAYSVSKGASKSCGCLNSEKTSARNRTHGLRDMREYHVWSSMVQRCTNPNKKEFPHYGGRGIKVHHDWIGRGGFAHFIEHIGPSPTEDHEVDRVDTNGNYEPGNVRWATRSEQMRNKRDNRMITFRGETKCLAEWSEITGISRYCIMFRLDRYGWTTEKALTTPSMPSQKRM